MWLSVDATFVGLVRWRGDQQWWSRHVPRLVRVRVDDFHVFLQFLEIKRHIDVGRALLDRYGQHLMASVTKLPVTLFIQSNLHHMQNATDHNYPFLNNISDDRTRPV